MEVVGGVASVIAIVELAAKITKICAGYIKEVREYEAEIKALANRFECLQKVLEELEGLLKGPHQEKLKNSKKLRDTLVACKDELQILASRLEVPTPAPAPKSTGGLSTRRPSKFQRLLEVARGGSRGRASSVSRALTWPIEKAEVSKIISRLEEVEEVIRFALQIDQTEIMLEVDTKLNLVNLPVTDGASFNWYGDDHEPKCLPNTREDLLKEIDDWVNGPPGKHIFWLSGAAGTGKSTIARTVAEIYGKAKLLGGSFFFRRGAGDRASASKFFTTLATNLMQHIPAMKPTVSNIIEKEPDIVRKILKEQFDKLIFQPLSLADHTGRIVLVIDALDECDNEQDVLTIVKLLGLLKELKGPNVRIFLTSRGEVFINAGFQKISGDFKDVILHDIEEQTILHDITVFLKYELEKIKEDHVYRDTLPSDWPTQSTIETLAKMACPLFIVASTICRFIEDPESLPGELLAGILEGQHKLIEANPERSLSLIYLQIMNQRMMKKSPSQKKIMLKEFQKIMGTIVLLQTPMSRSSLAQFTDMPELNIKVRLDGFQSVLRIPEASNGVIKTFHLSFREFMLDPETKEQSPLWIDECQVHGFIGRRCIAIMKEHLRKNICDLSWSKNSLGDIPICNIYRRFPEELKYACIYWTYHLSASGEEIRDEGEAHQFLQEYILEWLEATSFLRYSFSSIDATFELESVVSESCGHEVKKLLYDIRRFIRSNYDTIAKLPLQIYYSALLFSPENCLLRKMFYHLHLDWVLQGPKVPRDWGNLLQKIQNNTSLRQYVDSLGFYAQGDRERLVINYYEVIHGIGGSTRINTATIWDMRNGALLKLETDLEAFPIRSLDGKWSARGTDSSTISISDPLNGLVAKRLAPFLDPICTSHKPLAFSYDGKHFLSFIWWGDSKLGKLMLWETASWGLIDAWESSGNTDDDRRGVFSRDGSLIFSWGQGLGEGPGFEVREVKSGKLLQRLMVNPEKVQFSPNGEYLACGDSTADPIDILHLNRNRLEHISVIPDQKNSSFVFLSDEELAVCTGTGTISVWSHLSATLVRTIGIGYKGSGGMALSPDRKTLAVSRHDRGVELWESHAFSAISGYVIGEKPSLGNRPDEGGEIRQRADNAVEAQDQVAFVALSPNCGFVASATKSEPGITLWKMYPDKVALHSRLQFEAGEELWEGNEADPSEHLSQHQQQWRNFGVFSGDGKLLAAAAVSLTKAYAKLRVWSTETSELLYEYESSGEFNQSYQYLGLEQLAISPDNETLAVAFGIKAPILVFSLKPYHESTVPHLDGHVELNIGPRMLDPIWNIYSRDMRIVVYKDLENNQLQRLRVGQPETAKS
ncbi:hypothetical protein TWF481_003285 [Arthrobotrys musiformis]|uniref:NACHT domain-containing protein n=1 Tax=Arthrobotrys musiformis TaxID=47236 RepID=A0AAV9VRX1_9PEZI